jgi:hypothetical protein
MGELNGLFVMVNEKKNTEKLKEQHPAQPVQGKKF